MFKKILIATDGSDHSKKAIELGSALAAKDGAEVVLVHVLLAGEVDADVQRLIDVEYPVSKPMPKPTDDARNDILAIEPQGFDIAKHKAASYRIFQILGDQIVQQAVRTLKTKGVNDIQSLVLEGNPAEQILKAIADEEPDLVICGARGLSSFAALLFGSVSNKIAHMCPVTCITVR
ncbi:universal stress protein [Rhizobium binae]|uniref:universal stress protein n=1 Tax=Rhizobium binae TaxID=1138190 RepID=UPI001C83F5F6|nr:universal stress protein [Rhizobium binae]MBX4936358.1 universal stress protein [Rhizobium binae]MBX4942681.1 universal stress protein [Rhizobium binae]MBX4966854.1 universal stress protein [Rhizobium binae]MBX4978288.1 universal stress protein [Rhizobium binae]